MVGQSTELEAIPSRSVAVGGTLGSFADSGGRKAGLALALSWGIRTQTRSTSARFQSPGLS